MGGWCVCGHLKATGFEYPYDPDKYFGYGDYTFKVPEVFLCGTWNGCTQRTGNYYVDEVIEKRDNVITIYKKITEFDHWMIIGNKKILCKEEDIPHCYGEFTDDPVVPVETYEINVYDTEKKTKKVFRGVLEQEDIPYRDYEISNYIEQKKEKNDETNG